MKVSKPVYALWCGSPCGQQNCGSVKDILACLTPDPCGNCS